MMVFETLQEARDFVAQNPSRDPERLRIYYVPEARATIGGVLRYARYHVRPTSQPPPFAGREVKQR